MSARHRDEMNRERLREWGYPWHYALNGYMTARREAGEKPPHLHWMYEAKSLAEEAMRLPLLFERERKGELAGSHQQCSHSEPEPIPDNHLRCCLGTECRKCPHLLALEHEDLTGEQLDLAKSWTCISHILHTCGGGEFYVDTSEGMILTTGDRMYWDRVYANLAAAQP